MAEEKSETEQTTDTKETVEQPTETVKKKAAKKKAAKKKVASKKKTTSKKKATSKKKTAVKKKAAAPVATPASAMGDEGKPAPAPAPQPSVAEPATATAVTAAAASSDEEVEKPVPPAASDVQASARSETVIKAKIIKEKPPEDRSMASESKSVGGFWAKAIFWLLIVVLAFILIRSLAKHPGEEPTVTTDEEIQEGITSTLPMIADKVGEGAVSQQVEAEDAATSEQEMAVSEVVEERPKSLGQEAEGDVAASAVQRDEAGGVAEQPAVMETTIAPPTDAAATEEAPTEVGAAEEAQAFDASVAETPDLETPSSTSADTAAIPPAAGAPTDARTAQQRLRDQHEESVARILKEFDELREAARAEMEAMRNLIQAERELRDTMAPQPPSAYPPAWRTPGAGYGPYTPAPQYYPRY
jgi:hypothetical protein